MSLVEWPTVPNTNTNANQLGGDWGNLISKYYTGIDIGSGTGLAPDVNTNTIFRTNRLQVLDTGLDHTVKFDIPDDYSASRTLQLPSNTAWASMTDKILMEAGIQNMSNKVLSTNIFSVDLNSLNHSTTNAAGDMLVGDGTVYTRRARGTALQVWRVNAGGTDTEWATISAGSSTLDGLTDVVITSPADNQVLTYDSASGNWINEAPPGGGGGGDVFLGASNTFGDFDNVFRSGRLKVRNPANSQSYSFVGSAITGAINITLPLLTANDIAVTEAFAQPLTNKTIAAGSNTITGLVDANLSAHTSTKITITAKGQLNSALVYNDQANTFGAFNQLFPTTRLRLGDSDASHAYIFAGSNLTADRTVTWPLLTGNDVPLLEAFAATMTNKTFNTTDNSLTATSQATGDILANNGSKFIRKARGTGLQVLRTNSGATDIEWASLDSERVGKSTASGNNSTTVFNIAHGLGSNPTYAFISVADCGSSMKSMPDYTTDATNIVVTFGTAPETGTNNVVIYWRVVA